MTAPHAFTEEDHQVRFDWRVWARIFRFTAPYRRQVIALATVSVLTAGIDASFTLVVRRVIDGVVEQGAGTWMVGWGILYGVLVATLCVGVYLFITLGGRIATGVSHDVRRDAFAKLQQLPFAFYDQRPVGWLMARLTSDCDRMSRILGWRIVDGLWATCLLLLIAGILVAMEWRLALIVFAVVPMLIGISVYFRSRILAASRDVRKANSYLTASYNEAIAGVRTTRSLVREQANLDEFRGHADGMYRSSVRNALYSAVFLPVVFSLGALGTGLVLWIGGGFARVGAISIGTLVAFLAYTRQFFDPTHVLAHLLTELQTAQAAGERLVRLLEADVEIRDSEEVVAAIERHRGTRGRAIDGYEEQIDRIEFRDVEFTYRDGPTVLDGFSLDVRAGETIALVGPTGGGKSTIVSLVCRFYEPTGGGIHINGREYRRRSLQWLQSSLGIVLQTPHLFSGTIRDNIRYGRLDASDDDIEAAARLANAHGFITALEHGYDSEVGEGGNRLSTGQKQLVSFARAVLADPQIFVMDEATSSIDTEAERLIQDGLHAILAGRISFVIAHRLSTVRAADRILVIDGGRIVEEGDHDRLMTTRGRYYELYMNQFARDREAEVFASAAVAAGEPDRT